MKIPSKYLLLLFVIALNAASFGQKQIPRLQKKEMATQLIVDGKAFVIRGGELGNSSATSMEYLAPIWPKLNSMNVNTILVPVYWELIEKEEGKFDYSLLRKIISEARKNNLKIVFLWFGSWKNSMSSHAPAWVKLNQEKYPRAKDEKLRSQEILSPFSENNLNADLKAFENLMRFIKDFDGSKHTVIMIQVENEIGMLPSARDYSEAANEAFKGDIPEELMNFMIQNKTNLLPEILSVWKENGFRTKGSWEGVFGKGGFTDECFMAWYFSKYTNKITEAGKKIYPLPMFVNAALNKTGKQPGLEYPSAGPLPHLMDIWKLAGPSIDFLSPDFYNPDFKHWNDLYTRQGDLLFIPEHRFDNTVAPKSLYAIAHYDALGFSPFSIESTANPQSEAIGKMYGIIKQLTPLITSHQGEGKIDGVLLDKTNQESIVRMGNYEFTFKHDYTLGWSPQAKDDEWPMTAAILIHTGENEFYFGGSGVVATFKVLGDSTMNAGILKTEEGRFEGTDWKIIRHLNGDQTHQGRHVRISADEYGIQRFELYMYR